MTDIQPGKPPAERADSLWMCAKSGNIVYMVAQVGYHVSETARARPIFREWPCLSIVIFYAPVIDTTDSYDSNKDPLSHFCSVIWFNTTRSESE